MNSAKHADRKRDKSLAKPTDDEIADKFGYKAINQRDKILVRLNEVEKNFYNRLESAKLIKKQGHIPFTEHMTVGKEPRLCLIIFSQQK